MLRISVALALLAVAAPAFADTHISFVDASGQPASQIYVKGGKVRIEGGGRGIALYDASSNSMTMLLPDQKKYLVMNEKAADQMGAAASNAPQQSQAAAQVQSQMAGHQADMDQANQKMQQAMANMTPEQKAMMQQAMRGRGMPSMGGAGPAPVGGMQMDTKDLGSSETVAGHKCEDMQLSMNGQAVVTTCVYSGSAESLGIPAADVKTLEAMRAGMQKLQSHLGPMGQGMAAMMGKGFSLKTTHQTYKDMRPATETDTFKDVSTAGLDTSLFTVPAGYTQTTMQEMMQQHHP